jgi:type I restriction enzyme M protein
MSTTNFQQLANFIWSVADLLRGPYRPQQYERVMLPLTVLRRFDAVLARTKESVLKKHAELTEKDDSNVDMILNRLATDEDGNPLGFHNHSHLDFRKLKGDPDNIGRHLTTYINGFSENIREIFAYFQFEEEIERLGAANRLHQIVAQFAEMDLHPERVDNITMGLVFEDLIRRFNEANEEAGEHFTPREVVQLMVNLLLEPDTRALTQDGISVTICDPACGTGGMLAESQNWIRAHNPNATVNVFGQDCNPHVCALAAADLLIKGHKDSRIACGNTLIDDPFAGLRFDYLLAHPPFGVSWTTAKKEIDLLSDFHGYTGKLPRVSDSALLFLLYMTHKFHPWEPGNRDKPGSRVAIVFNGSPLFTGGAGSGESAIRRWIIENDSLEAIVALPEQMFYNTGIGTFIWIVSNRKEKHRQGRIQLIDGRERWTPMKRSLGSKRRYLNQDALDALTREHGAPADSTTSKIFDNADFGYRRITVQRPLRLRFQLTQEAKERFLDVCPELLDAILAVEDALGNEPHFDWNQAWDEIQHVFKANGGWTPGGKGSAQKRLFRDVFTSVDPEAEAVVGKQFTLGDNTIGSALFPKQTLPKLSAVELSALHGLHAGSKGKQFEYEADPALKDTENIPLKEDIVSYFLREVRPYIGDAWIDRETLDEQDGGIGKVGYEINFNRVFSQYQAPRPLKEIDKELAAVERRIIELLREVAE